MGEVEYLSATALPQSSGYLGVVKQILNDRLAMNKQQTQISKFLSYVLRHRPDEIGIHLDAQGWVAIDSLLTAAASHGTHITREQLDDVVKNNNKQRFAVSEDGAKIRASQGHSTDIDLGYTPSTPPAILYHGTATRFIASIRTEGLLKGKRNHVHLSRDSGTATQVGVRHGTPIVLIIRTGEMAAAGYEFYLSANGVWLTAHVPATFIDFGPCGGSRTG